MSRATLYVRFPDGTVRYGLYNGTIDLACGPLYDTPGEAWNAYDLSGGHRLAEDMPVQIATDYGSGYAWTGRAVHGYVTDGFDPDESVNYSEGLPSWARYPAGVGETSE